jgi:hypothetical protein
MHNFYSILIRLLEPEPSSNEAGETWVRNMTAEFCLRSICFMLVRFFHMLYIYDMGPTALLPLRRKSCYVFLSPLKIHRSRLGLNPRTLGKHSSTRLPMVNGATKNESPSKKHNHHDVTSTGVCGMLKILFTLKREQRTPYRPVHVCPSFAVFVSG